ncbi:SRPBCC family protein [Algoriella sp.]|uniref:SRPBCC family protein n=1 Tax=Algoriella sp. TaxID=1872434 RepID=UPI001B23AE2C|nr:SRPBCC family protein [Algoriella sp.]MBO6213842.1 SRPBCC family protein [Algoriella sp.]
MITVQTTVNAPLEKVWFAFNNPEDIVKWNQASPDWHCPKAENDLQNGGTLKSTMAAKDGSFQFEFEAKYDEIIPNKFIRYYIADGRKVEIDFMEENNSTVITEKFDPENQNPEEMQRQGWQAILDSFKNYVETKNE